MAAKRTEYQLVGRYMDGKSVIGYHLYCMDNGKNGRYTPEQFAYLVGRGQVTNVEGQVFKDDMLYRGTNGTDINKLPVQNADGTLSRTQNVGHIRKGATGQDVMTQLMFVAKIRHPRDRRKLLGYVVQNSGGRQQQLNMDEAYQAARSGKIGNARAQLCNGDQLIKANEGYSLGNLPEVDPCQHVLEWAHSRNLI